MKVVSLFDGISCGRVALERAGLSVSRYVAFEIDQHAKNVSAWNWPDVEQRGDVSKADFTEFAGFDLLIGGSPCQGFSFAGKQLNFEDPRSKLFFEYVRALKEIKPRYFLLENVVMKPESVKVISDTLGVEPILINSNLVSAQNRKRLYWTNIPGVTQPEDRGVKLVDILENLPLKLPEGLGFREKSNCLRVGGRRSALGSKQIWDSPLKLLPGAVRGREIIAEGLRKKSQCLEVRLDEKSNCLTTVNKDNVLTPLPPGKHVDAFLNALPFRYYSPVECERLQTLPDGYTEMISNTQRYKALGNGWTVDVIAQIFKNIT